MNSASNVMNESPAQATAIAPSTVSWSRQMYWCVRRELWEYKSIYIAPIAGAALALVACSISMMRLPERMRTADPMQQWGMIDGPFTLAALLIMGVTFVVALFYSLDALYGERRDRSILFWKSLPVSDRTTVLAKASIPMLILPVLTFAVTIVAQAIILIVTKAVLAASGVNAEAAWNHLSFWHLDGMLIYHLVAIHGLWFAPFYGWLLLVSAWAKRLPILWATLPPIAIGVFEKIAFNTSYFANLLGFASEGDSGSHATSLGALSLDAMTDPMPGEFLSSSRLWIGLVVTGVFLLLAARLRRQRGPI